MRRKYLEKFILFVYNYYFIESVYKVTRNLKTKSLLISCFAKCCPTARCPGFNS